MQLFNGKKTKKTFTATFFLQAFFLFFYSSGEAGSLVFLTYAFPDLT
jgi:hypothetical protein